MNVESGEDASGPPRKRQRKQRPAYSCEECRRLKMKCDRQVPCSNCVRRHRVDLCNGAAAGEVHFQPSELEAPSLGSSAVPHTNATASLAQTIPSVASGTSVSADPVPQQRFNDVDESGSYGTLMLSKGGRSKYLGPTAGTEWLKDSETQDVSDSPSATITHPATPELSHPSVPSQISIVDSHTASVAFPFNGSLKSISTRALLSHLPPRDEAWSLVESYYRYCAWHHDVAPRTQFTKTFERVYSLSNGHAVSPPLNPQEIALVFVVMAQGTVYNIEMPMCDPSAEEWLHLSERALVKGEFFSNNTLAGLQTLHLMAHMHLELDKGRRGDNAWPLFGLVMRLGQAMGMHRDGVRWNLPEDVVEERRKVFWEVNAADTFQAHCFSRPCIVNPEHCDTVFPTEPRNVGGEKSYTILRFELSQLSSEILHMAMKIRKPAYPSVTELDSRLADFERNLPFSLRSRAAFLAMPSRYSLFEDAIQASPEPSRRSMTISFQQMNLALNISETIINLHRPYYAKALYDDVDTNGMSLYAPSFFAVIERCAIIIAIVSDIHNRFPAVSTRQWNFWFHVFGSALCLGTLVLRDPSSAMATFVLAQLDAAVGLFTSLIQHGASTPRYQRNLQWLLKLRARALAKIEAISTGQAAGRRQSRGDGAEDGEGIELLGWRTRLIERVHQGQQTSKTVRLATTPVSTKTRAGQSLPSVNPEDASLPTVPSDSMDDLLRNFWDPMLVHDFFEVPFDQAYPYPALWEDTTLGQNGV